MGVQGVGDDKTRNLFRRLLRKFHWKPVYLKENYLINVNDAFLKPYNVPLLSLLFSYLPGYIHSREQKCCHCYQFPKFPTPVQ